MIIRKLVTLLGFKTDNTGLKSYNKSIEDSKKKSDQYFSSLRTYGAAMTAGITAPMLLAGRQFVNFAANAQETGAMFRQVFGGLGGVAGDFAKQLGENLGRSETDIKNNLARFQAFAVGQEMADDSALKFSARLQSLSFDFAAFWNIGDDEAAQRFISGLSGSSEVLDMFGINLKVAALEQELLSMGIKESVNDVDEQTKTIARARIIEKALGRQGAIGQAFKEKDSYANQLKNLAAQYKSLGEEVGLIILPYMLKFIKYIREAIRFVKQLSPEVKKIVLIFSAFIGVLGPILLSIGTLAFALKGLQTVFGGLNLLMSPFLLTLGAIAFVIYDLYRFLDGKKTITEMLWGKAKEGLKWAGVKAREKMTEWAYSEYKRSGKAPMTTTPQQLEKTFMEIQMGRASQDIKGMMQGNPSSSVGQKAILAPTSNNANTFNNTINVKVEGSTSSADEIGRKASEQISSLIDSQIRNLQRDTINYAEA
jgi:hypothetical protein